MNTSPPVQEGNPKSPTPVKKWWPDWDAITWLTLAGVFISLVVGIASLRETHNSLRQSNIDTIYSLGFEVTKYQEENPNLAKFLDKELRQPWITEQDYWSDFDKHATDLSKEEQAKVREEYVKMWDEYRMLDEHGQTLLYLGCERIADFSQIAFMQREILPDEDWNTWWSYLTDQYDESPFYRIFLSKRPSWYAFIDAIKPQNRDSFFRRK